MELHELDLNLLVVFQQLLAERRVSRTAEVLGVSQPAVSNSLAKLRRLFGDELFLRTPRGMEPTRARPTPIGMTDIGEIYFLPTRAAGTRWPAAPRA